jgi:hypothetical protein
MILRGIGRRAPTAATAGHDQRAEGDEEQASHAASIREALTR